MVALWISATSARKRRQPQARRARSSNGSNERTCDSAASGSAFKMSLPASSAGFAARGARTRRFLAGGCTSAAASSARFSDAGAHSGGAAFGAFGARGLRGFGTAAGVAPPAGAGAAGAALGALARGGISRYLSCALLAALGASASRTASGACARVLKPVQRRPGREAGGRRAAPFVRRAPPSRHVTHFASRSLPGRSALARGAGGAPAAASAAALPAAMADREYVFELKDQAGAVLDKACRVTVGLEGLTLSGNAASEALGKLGWNVLLRARLPSLCTASRCARAAAHRRRADPGSCSVSLRPLTWLTCHRRALAVAQWFRYGPSHVTLRVALPLTKDYSLVGARRARCGPGRRVR
jgi:hypothetical protein